MGRLDNRVAIITGAARGMGEATARIFAAEGARVVLADVLDAAAADVAADIGEAAHFVHLDVREETEWQEVLRQTVERFDTPDILVNNAGILSVGRILDLDSELLHEVFDINLVGPTLGMKVIGRVMIETGRGSIVNVSSSGGLIGMSTVGAYVASKWALRGISKSAAIEFGPHGVRVNSLHPGGVTTPMVGAAAPALEEPPPFGQVDSDGALAAADERAIDQPIGRMGRPIEIARLALFLASDESSYCTGMEFTADGGAIAGQDLTGTF